MEWRDEDLGLRVAGVAFGRKIWGWGFKGFGFREKGFLSYHNVELRKWRMTWNPALDNGSIQLPLQGLVWGLL